MSDVASARAFGVLIDLFPPRAAGRRKQAARAAWGLVHGLAMLPIDGRLGMPATARTARSIARPAARAMVEGLGALIR